MRRTWFYEIGAPSNPECVGDIRAATATEAWRRVWTKANGRPCLMMDSRHVQSIDPGRKALAAGRTVRKVGSDGVTEYMADGGMLTLTDEMIRNLSDDATAVAQGWSVARYDADSATLRGGSGLPMFRGTYQEITTFIMGARCGRVAMRLKAR